MAPPDKRVQVKIKVGHQAICRANNTPAGHTHDWSIFVRGDENVELSHFVQKVCFILHDTYPKPKRVCREPPYKVTETGYGSFKLIIDIYFRNREEPRKYRVVYDLKLQLVGMPPYNFTKVERLTFLNPSEDFENKLITGGAVRLLPLSSDQEHKNYNYTDPREYDDRDGSEDSTQYVNNTVRSLPEDTQFNSTQSNSDTNMVIPVIGPTNSNSTLNSRNNTSTPGSSGNKKRKARIETSSDEQSSEREFFLITCDTIDTKDKAPNATTSRNPDDVFCEVLANQLRKVQEGMLKEKLRMDLQKLIFDAINLQQPLLPPSTPIQPSFTTSPTTFQYNTTHYQPHNDMQLATIAPVLTSNQSSVDFNASFSSPSYG